MSEGHTLDGAMQWPGKGALLNEIPFHFFLLVTMTITGAYQAQARRKTRFQNTMMTNAYAVVRSAHLRVKKNIKYLYYSIDKLETRFLSLCLFDKPLNLYLPAFLFNKYKHGTYLDLDCHI